MNFDKPENNQERRRETVVEPPAVESFLDPDHVADVWPEDIATDEVFVGQLRERKEAHHRFEDVFDRLPRPDMSIDEAVGRGYVTASQASMLYESLSDLLESDPENGRIVLYLPFELLSPIRQSEDAGLLRTSNRFRAVYKQTWKGLLPVYDVRANFVDGDVLEPEKRDGDLPRVVKAAHLIPKLVENGLVEIGEVLELMEGIDDHILRNSVADTFPVLADLGYVSEEVITRMKASSDRLVGNVARIIVSESGATQKKEEAVIGPISYASVRKHLSEEFSRIDTDSYGDATKKRIAWLKQQRKKDAIAALGKEIGKAISTNGLSEESIAEFLVPDAGVPSRQALVEGIREAIESVSSDDLKNAKDMYMRCKETLITLWETKNPDMFEQLSAACCRFGRLGIVDEGSLAELGVSVPKLSGRLSENLKSMSGELSETRDMVAAMESDEELSKSLFPVALVFGSRLKGYGTRGADTDLAVFVRPDVSENERPRIRALMKTIFPQEKIRGEVVEFWLEEIGNEFQVRDFEHRDVTVGEGSWTHVLFGAAWEGNPDAIRDLREKLLTPYLRESSAMIHGRRARSVYLEELERDALQYRLMHKGYERSNPPFGGIHTIHSDDVDGESMFWDSGYRQLATRLFIERVFLPNVSPSKK